MSSDLKQKIGLGLSALAMLVASATLGASVARLVRPVDYVLAATLRGAPPKPVPAPTIPLPPGDLGKLIASLKITVPDLAFDFSPLPKLKFSSFNLPFPDLPARGLFGNMGVDPSVNFRGDVSVSMPTVVIPDLTSSAPPADVPTGGAIPAGTDPPATGQAAPPTSGQPGQSVVEANVANCVQFSAVPSAQVCTMIPDLNGQRLCSACKNAGF